MCTHGLEVCLFDRALACCARSDIIAEFPSVLVRYLLFLQTCVDLGDIVHRIGLVRVTDAPIANLINASSSTNSQSIRPRICIFVSEIASNPAVSPGACDDLP